MCGEGSQERQAVQLRKSKRPIVERIGIQRGNWRFRERDRRTSMRSCKSNERRYSRITRGIVMCKATEKFCIAIASCLFWHISGEFNLRVVAVALGDCFYVTRRVGMISTCHYQTYPGHFCRNRAKCFDHWLQALVRSPLAKGKHTLGRLFAPRKVGILRTAGKDSMRAKVHMLSAIFFK